MKKLSDYIKNGWGKVCNRMMMAVYHTEEGMGVVEVVLIILVLVGLVIIFKNQITGIVNSVFNKITTKVNTI